MVRKTIYFIESLPGIISYPIFFLILMIIGVVLLSTIILTFWLLSFCIWKPLIFIGMLIIIFLLAVGMFGP